MNTEALRRTTHRPSPVAYATIALLIVALVLVLVGMTLWQARLRHQDRASVATQNVARLLEEYVVGTLDKVDLSLRSVADEYAHQLAGGRIDPVRMNEFLRDQRSFLGDIATLRVTDQDGTVQFGPGVDPGKPVSVADRDHFTQLRDDPDAGLVVSPPLFARINKTWIIVLARALRARDGSFAGMATAGIATDRFQKLISEVDLGSRGSATIRNADMALVFRHPAAQDRGAAIGSRDVSAELREALRTRPTGGVYVAVNVPDGIERFSAYRQVRKYPFYVIVGLATQDYLDEWKTDAIALVTMGSIVILVTLLSTVSIYRSSQRQADLAEVCTAEASKVQTIIRTASDGIHMLDAEGNVLEANEAFCRMLGYPREELLRMNVSQWDSQWSEPELKRIGAELLHKTAKFETRHRRSDGHMIDVEISSAGVEIGAQRVVFCSARDITERKRTEGVLHESEMRLREAQRIAKLGSYVYDIAGDAWTGSAELDRIFGISGDFDHSAAGWAGLIHPLQRDTALAALRECIEHQRDFDMEYRILRPSDGAERWLHGLGKAECDASGRAVRIVGTNLDITDRRLAEDRAQALLQEQQAILNSEVVGIVKLRTRVMFWCNSAYERMLGYEPGELHGKPTRIVYPDEESYIEFRNAAYPVINSGGVFRRRIQYMRKDGTLGWYDISGARLFAGSDESIWSFIDITHRMAVEKQLEQMAERDPLTRAYNRRKMAELFEIEANRAQRSGRTFTAGMLDIDQFKDVNDRFGHAVGDAVLVGLVEAIRKELRLIDILARWGGEEFLFLFHDSELNESLGIAERIRKIIDETNFPTAGHVTVSMGLSEFRSSDDMDSLIARADAALYEAKNAGRNRIAVRT